MSLYQEIYLNFRALAIYNYAEMSVRLFKKRDVTESRYGQNISSRSSSRKLGQVDDQGMRDGVHTIRDSCYHREKGAEKT